VVVDDLDFICVAILPYAANPPLHIDADRMLPTASAPQWLRPISRRNTQALQAAGIVEETQFPERAILDVLKEAGDFTALPDRRRLGIAEPQGHARISRMTL
jgi:hypothetical protein